MTKQNAINARDANKMAEQTRYSANKGIESMSRMSAAINNIKTSSDATAKIVKTIDEIAFQTNLFGIERGEWNAARAETRGGDLQSLRKK